MFEKIYLNRTSCSHFYIMMYIAFKIIYFLIITSFLYFIWQQRYVYMDLFETHKMIKAHDTKNWTEYTDLFKLIGTETIYFLGKILIITLIIKIFNNIKIPNVWLKKWDDDMEIDNLFGRHLCEHIRFHKKINFKNFNSLHRFCNRENRILEKVKKDSNLTNIFNKYDKNYTSDIKR